VVRAALSFVIAQVLAAGGAPAAIADAILWGREMPPAEQTASLPKDVQQPLAEYRQRARTFQSALKAPPGATDTERALFDARVAIERVVFCLFSRREAGRVAASYASDVEVAGAWEGAADARREAVFIDGLLGALPQAWLAPYLNLVAGHRKLCASRLPGIDSDAERGGLAEAGRRQLARARDAGHPLIRVAAEEVLAAGRCAPP